jgi:pyruvate kinase
MLRRRDLRDLQDQLTLRGLSSLGRARGPCTGNLDAMIAALGPHVGEPTRLPSARTFYRGERLLARNSIELFGRRESRRRAIMVTLGTDAAEEPDLVLASSAVAWTSPESMARMTPPDVWGRMAAKLRRAGRACRRDLRILFDLAGPSCRTAEVVLIDRARLLGAQVEDVVELGDHRGRGRDPEFHVAALPASASFWRASSSVPTM